MKNPNEIPVGNREILSLFVQCTVASEFCSLKVLIIIKTRDDEHRLQIMNIIICGTPTDTRFAHLQVALQKHAQT